LRKAVNVTAASAGGTHIIGAKLGAIITALFIFHHFKHGNAPILLDSRILVGKLRRANRRNGILIRADELVNRLKVVTKMSPRNATVNGANDYVWLVWE
jgi:hypothetical protein